MVLGTEIRCPGSFVKIQLEEASQKPILTKVKIRARVKGEVKVKVKGMVMIVVLGTQIKFPENLLKIRQDLAKLESSRN